MNREKLELPRIKDIDPNKMEIEKASIRTMSDGNKEDFVKKLFNTKDSKITDNPLDADITCLSIDPETMEYFITNDGQQELANLELTFQVRDLQEKREGKRIDIDQEHLLRRRFISGFIISGVDGFSSPFFVTNIFDFDEAGFKNLVGFLGKQDFIAVTEYGDLIE